MPSEEEDDEEAEGEPPPSVRNDWCGEPGRCAVAAAWAEERRIEKWRAEDANDGKEEGLAACTHEHNTLLP
jgi:hypothetical protein